MKPISYAEYDRLVAEMKLPKDVRKTTPEQWARLRELAEAVNAHYAALAEKVEPGDADRFLAYLAAGGDFRNKDWKRDPRTPPAPTQMEG